jgi:hypothetical protein
VLITPSTLLARSCKVTFWTPKKFTRFTQVYTRLPPDVRSSARPANRTDRLGPDTACCLQPTRARRPGDPASARANLGPSPDSPKHRAAHGTRSGQTRAAHGTRSRANLDRVRPDKPGPPRAPGPLSNGRKVLGEGPSFRTRRSSTSTTPRRSCKPLDGTNSGPSSSSSSS